MLPLMSIISKHPMLHSWDYHVPSTWPPVACPVTRMRRKAEMARTSEVEVAHKQAASCQQANGWLATLQGQHQHVLDRTQCRVQRPTIGLLAKSNNIAPQIAGVAKPDRRNACMARHGAGMGSRPGGKTRPGKLIIVPQDCEASTYTYLEHMKRHGQYMPVAAHHSATAPRLASLGFLQAMQAGKEAEGEVQLMRSMTVGSSSSDVSSLLPSFAGKLKPMEQDKRLVPLAAAMKCGCMQYSSNTTLLTGKWCLRLIHIPCSLLPHTGQATTLSSIPHTTTRTGRDTQQPAQVLADQQYLVLALILAQKSPRLLFCHQTCLLDRAE